MARVETTLGERLRRVPIGLRLALMIAVVLGLAFGLFGAGSLYLLRRNAMRSVQSDSKRLAASLERALRSQMLTADPRKVGDMLSRIPRRGGVRSIRLLTGEGETRYATEPARVGERLGKDSPACVRCHGAGDQLVSGTQVELDRRRTVATTVTPILNDPSCSEAACHAHPRSRRVLGLMIVEVPFGHVARSLERYRNWLVVMAVGVVSAAFLVVLLLIRRWVVRPVATLVDATRRVARGDLTHTIDLEQGEMGELAGAFNRMQARLAASQRQLLVSEKLASVGRLAAGVAHEINNPLTGILTFAEELLEEADDDAPQREDYEVIQHEAIRCRTIVRNLLDFARQGQPAAAAISPHLVLRRTVQLVGRLAAFHDVVLDDQVPADLPSVMGDATQLQQVFLNLMVNAAEAMQGNGRLTLRGRATEQDVVLELADTGPGIDEDDLPRIFEPFFSTKGGKSSGLGLSVSWNIIDQHGGELSVESRRGQGTVFRVRLPAAPTQAVG